MKNAVSDELLVMCDDYESQWRLPDDAQLYENALTEEVQVVSATERDIRAVGWDRWRGATTEL